MATSMILTTTRSSEPLDRVDPEMFRQRSRRSDALRVGAIAALAISLATVVVSLSAIAGAHLIAAWWLGSVNGRVSWEIDKTNWQHGGETSVSFSLRNTCATSIGDDDLAQVRNLHRVVSLDLADNDRITEKGLASLRGLNFLSDLSLERLDRFRQPPARAVSIPLNNACLVHLQALPRLETLSLSGNRITDQGLSQVARMASLKVLDLTATEISDAGLVYLEGMKSLERVNLGATGVTKKGIAQLQMARPDLLIELETEPGVEQEASLARGLTQ